MCMCVCVCVCVYIYENLQLALIRRLADYCGYLLNPPNMLIFKR